MTAKDSAKLSKVSDIINKSEKDISQIVNILAAEKKNLSAEDTLLIGYIYAICGAINEMKKSLVSLQGFSNSNKNERNEEK